MKITLVGASALAGHPTAQLIAASGTSSLQLTSRTPPGAGDWPAGASWRYADLLEPESLLSAFAHQDAVLVAASPWPRDTRDPRMALRDSALMARNLVLAARTTGVSRLIVTSCATTVGPTEDAATETDLFLPHRHSDTWAECKYLAETEILAANSPDLHTCVLLPTLLLGPGLSTLRPRHPLLHPNTWAAPPSTPLHLLDTRDLARCALAALRQARPGGRYILHGHTTSLEQLALLLNDLSLLPDPTTNAPTPPRPSAWTSWLQKRPDDPAPHPWWTRLHSMPPRFDTTKARRELGLKPRKLTLTLRDTFAPGTPPC